MVLKKHRHMGMCHQFNNTMGIQHDSTRSRNGDLRDIFNINSLGCHADNRQ